VFFVIEKWDLAVNTCVKDPERGNACVWETVNTFWSSGNCQLYRKKNGLEKTTYCHHNKGVQGVCSWELKTAINPVSTCAGTSGGTSYLTKEDNGRACVKHHNN
jgi:hypothetical protein